MKQELLILPFDHRSSFLKDILGLSTKPNKKEKDEIKELKKIIFDGFLLASKKEKSFGILVDEEYGEEILKEAKRRKITICLPVEKSGEKILKLNYPKNFEEHIDKFNPDFVKILIRYNPLNKKDNQKQLKVLSQIDAFCQKRKYEIILELLVSPAKEDLQNKNYETNIRAERTAEAIKEIKEKIKVSIWKLEGFESNQWKEIIKVINKESKIIFLGRGEDKKKVVRWIKAASGHKEIIGFAIGRTIFLEVLKKYHAKKISRETAVKLISNNFKYFVNLWRKEK
jgi:myo-inositol catabolism protein IolC